MIYLEKPQHYTPNFEIVGCFFECNGEILLLHRLPHKSFGDTWGCPAGKVDDGESLEQAMLREISEETGIVVDAKNLQFYKTVYVENAGLSFPYHMIRTVFQEKPHIQIEKNEHVAYRWVKPQKALELPLIHDLAECIQMYYFPQ